MRRSLMKDTNKAAEEFPPPLLRAAYRSLPYLRPLGLKRIVRCRQENLYAVFIQRRACLHVFNTNKDRISISNPHRQQMRRTKSGRHRHAALFQPRIPDCLFTIAFGKLLLMLPFAARDAKRAPLGGRPDCRGLRRTCRVWSFAIRQPVGRALSSTLFCRCGAWLPKRFPMRGMAAEALYNAGHPAKEAVRCSGTPCRKQLRLAHRGGR